eukprot:scaffold3.g6205.t1
MLPLARIAPLVSLQPLTRGFAALSSEVATGLNILKKGSDPPLRPDAELPEWLWALAESEKTLNELRRTKDEDLSDAEALRLVKLKNRDAIRTTNNTQIMALSTLVQRAVATTCRVGTLSLLGAQRHFSKEADDRPLTWVFLGPPGVGKGTYATRISDTFGFWHIAAGDLVRMEMKQGTELGKQMEEIVNRGQLLPDALITRVLREHLMREASAEGASKFLLDGFPRTVTQAAELDQVVGVALAVNLSLREEVLVQKCLGRRICRKCGKNYNVADIYLPAGDGRPEIVMPPLNPPPECMQHMEQRSDDTEPVVRKRLEARGEGPASVAAAAIEVYKAQAAPVEQFYRETGVLLDFEITGGIPETLPRLLATLQPFQPIEGFRNTTDSAYTSAAV